MNHSGITKTTVLAFALAVSGFPAFANAQSVSSALEQYQRGIDNVSREINVAKEHRTAIISRMDDIGRQLESLDLKSAEVGDHSPDINAGISHVQQEISSLQTRIAEIDHTLNLINTQLGTLSPPTVLEDALGKSTDKRRAIAVKHYQLYKTKNQLNALEKQRLGLVASKNSMFQSQRDIASSLSALNNKRQLLRDKKAALENQFIQLTATIVQKQDRSSTLTKRAQDIRQDPKNGLFTTFRGQLNSPTRGVLRHNYAEPKTRGMLQWEGIVIGAPLGAEISTVFDGSVVFADSMQGLGNVAIIDHGEGYMSVYGMTDFLIVQPGQYVLAGDTIGAVGGASGDDKSGLYFEIRHNARTVDPAEWLNLQTISQETESRPQLY